MVPGPEPHVVLCLSGHDPTGGAGIQADIETTRALGGHAVTAITAMTHQDTANVYRVTAPAPGFLESQLATLLADVRIGAVKVGLIGDWRLVAVIADTLRRLRAPVVLDPVLRAGGGRNLATTRLIKAIRAQLLPCVEVVTPNRAELKRLAGNRLRDKAAAAELLGCGARSVLVTDGDGSGDTVVNAWYRQGRARRYAWKRLPGGFHGAGCTLSAAIATLLARGFPTEAAVQDAQAFTHDTLRRAVCVGRGRRIPDRRPV